MTNTGILNREIHTTRNGHRVELRTLAAGGAKIISKNFVGTYQDTAFARYIANIIFMELTLGCYACALDKVGRRYRDGKPHTCGK